MAKKVTKKPATKKKKKKKKATTTRKPRRTTAKAKPATPAVTPTITDEQIRLRAFEIYRAGWNPSNPNADWYQAERELQAEIRSR